MKHQRTKRARNVTAQVNFSSAFQPNVFGFFSSGCRLSLFLVHLASLTERTVFASQRSSDRFELANLLSPLHLELLTHTTGNATHKKFHPTLHSETILYDLNAKVHWQAWCLAPVLSVITIAAGSRVR